MAADFNVKENIGILFEKLEGFLKSKTVIGEPINVGDVTLIPIITVNFGLGTGGGDGADPKGSKGVGGGAGIGAKISPTSIIVIKGEKIEVLPIKQGAGLDKLIEAVPDIISKIKPEKTCSEKNESEEKE